MCEAKNRGSISRLEPKSSIISLVKSSTISIRPSGSLSDFGLACVRRAARSSASISCRTGDSYDSLKASDVMRHGFLGMFSAKKVHRLRRHGLRLLCATTKSVYGLDVIFERICSHPEISVAEGFIVVRTTRKVYGYA